MRERSTGASVKCGWFSKGDEPWWGSLTVCFTVLQVSQYTFAMCSYREKKAEPQELLQLDGYTVDYTDPQPGTHPFLGHAPTQKASSCWQDSWSMLGSNLIHQRVSGWKPKEKHTLWGLCTWDHIKDKLYWMLLKISMRKNMY